MNLAAFLSPLRFTQLTLPLAGDAAASGEATPPAPATPHHSPADLIERKVPPNHGDRTAQVEGLLLRRLGERVRLEVHDNRSIMLSWKRRSPGIRVRLHHMFLRAEPAELAGVLGDFIGAREGGHGRRRAEASRWIDRFIRAHPQTIRAPKPPAPAEARGRAHDLQAIFDRLNAEYFGGAIDAQIGWGRPAVKQRRRSIKMGVYIHDHRQIRLHPALDREEVPAFLVEFVVYHEMCHQACPPEGGPGRRQRIHTRAFREREKLHPAREQALAWEKQNLRLLLRTPR